MNLTTDKDKHKKDQSRKDFSLPWLYCITYSEKSLRRTNVEVVYEMAGAGISCIQYREKELSMKEKLIECYKIREITKDHGITFIVNDHIDIAISVDADGIHLGQDDFPVADARKLLGSNKIIGVSTHSPAQALKAVSDNVDYIGVGPIYTTKTKKNVCPAVGLDYLHFVLNNISIPSVAIGGIKEHNYHEILATGASSVAMVSEITSSPNIAEKVNYLRHMYDSHVRS